MLHGVTALTSGTRKNFFVVDDTNKLGEDGVVQVMANHVTTFLTARAAEQRAKVEAVEAAAAPVLPICIICSKHAASIATIPCGHVCLCLLCESRVVDKCPVCQQHFSKKKKLYF